MTTFHSKPLLSWRRLFPVAVALIVAMRLTMSTTVRADDDDWDDDVQEYYEDLEERREKARERWEDWHEDREEALEDWYKDGGPRYYRYGPGYEYRTHHYPNREYYEYRAAPGYSTYYWEPRVYRSYRPMRQYRYYGTPDVGYTEFGRERSVQVGPYRVYWDRD
jgi:hypothetical protein